MNQDLENDKIDQLLTRGVEEIIDKKNLEYRLNGKRKLRVKLGIDPTSPNLHLGRAIPLLKLRDFQELGHKIILIIGDFTGIIGDTSDKDSERPMLTEQQIDINMKNYVAQAKKIIDIDQCEVVHNSKWLGKLRYKEIGEQADIFSINEFISRENIKKRLNNGKRVSLREVLYPLMQGFDSIKVRADVEVGGTDQRFNLLAGREMQRFFGKAPQDVIMNPLIEGLDGRKMSSSWGNTINLFDEPSDMFGKIMSLHDDLIIKYFTLATRADSDLIRGYKKDLADGSNPKDVKIKLAFEITKLLHSEYDASKARQIFDNVFTKKQIPDLIRTIGVKNTDMATVLVEIKAAKSKTEARRLLDEGAIRLNTIIEKDPGKQIKRGDLIQKGKRFFARIG